MLVKDLLNKENFKPLAVCDPDREINGVYIGDLLSWVMGRASADQAWITIMSNVNVLAVASLTDVACVILAEGVVLDVDLISTALEKGVNIISSALPAYETALIVSETV